MKPGSEEVFTLTRQLYTHDAIESVYTKQRESSSNIYSDKIKSKCSCSKKKAWNILTQYVPILKFIQKYNFKQFIIDDLMAGLNVAFMHLPQAMGFGLLAGLRPIYGLYSTFFPILFYAIFGTSPHVSFGTNAVLALLTQNVVEREFEYYRASMNLPLNDTSHLNINSGIDNVLNQTLLQNTSDFPSDQEFISLEEDILKIKVGAAMTSSMIVGLILGSMGLLRLGFLTTYLSASFIGGFTTAASIHIASSQVPKALGIKVGSHNGAGRLVKMYIDLFTNITRVRYVELIITVVCILVLLLVKTCINERFKKQMKIPIPIDLLIVIGGTVISHFARFETSFDVFVVGVVPTGIPEPVIPSFDGASRLGMDCFVMAILSLTMSISMAKLIAGQKGIKINDNQEILAYGISHIGSSFFSCFPQATAPPRTMILSSMNAKTTLNAVPTAIFILLVLLWIGQLFSSLPVSVLAAMIIVSMKELFFQLGDLPRIWRINKYDFVIWVLTFLISVLVDLDYGILCGVGLSIFFVVLQQQTEKGKLMGRSKYEDVIIDIKDRDHTTEYTGIKIFQYGAPINFANAEIFKTRLNKLVGNAINIKKQRQKQTKLADKSQCAYVNENCDVNGSVTKANTKHDISDMIGDNTPHHVVLDFQMITFIDMTGVKILKMICKEYNDIGVTVFIARCPSKVIDVLDAASFFEDFPKDNVFFEIIDAVNAAQSNNVVDTAKPSFGHSTKL